MPFGKPLQKWTGVMQPHPDGRMLCQVLQKGKVRLLVDFLQHAVEISDRLVAVNQEHQMDFCQDQTPPVGNIAAGRDEGTLCSI